MPNSGIAEDAAEGVAERCFRMRPGGLGGPGRRVGSV